MNPVIANSLEIIRAESEEYGLDQKLEAFKTMVNSATVGDIGQLVSELNSEKNDFWTRELLSEPIAELGGVNYLTNLFDALERNKEEGHDNDLFLHNLTEVAISNPESCREKLENLLRIENFKHKNTAKWLLEFCE